MPGPVPPWQLLPHHPPSHCGLAPPSLLDATYVPAVGGHSGHSARPGRLQAQDTVAPGLAWGRPSVCESILEAVPDSQRGCGRLGRSPRLSAGRSTTVAPHFAWRPRCHAHQGCGSVPGARPTPPKRGQGCGFGLNPGSRSAARSAGWRGRPSVGRLRLLQEAEEAGPVANALGRAPWGVLKAVGHQARQASSEGLFIPLPLFSTASVPESRPPQGGRAVESAHPGPQRPLPAAAACGDRACRLDR